MVEFQKLCKLFSAFAILLAVEGTATGQSEIWKSYRGKKAVADPGKSDAEMIEEIRSKIVALTRFEEGAETPTKALSQFVAAAREARVDAMLALIDPKVRPLISLEVAVERAYVENRVFEDAIRAAMKQPASRFSPGFSTIYAESDLARIVDLQVLKTRELNPDHVVLTVLRKSKPFGSEAIMEFEQDVLAIRREGRWYLFYLIGHMYWTFCGAVENRPRSSVELTPMVQAKLPIAVQETLEESGTKRVLVLTIPIEEIHRNVVRAVEGNELSEGLAALRMHASLAATLRSRLLRNDINDWDTWGKLERPDREAIDLGGAAVMEVVRRAWQGCRDTAPVKGL